MSTAAVSLPSSRRLPAAALAGYAAFVSFAALTVLFAAVVPAFKGTPPIAVIVASGAVAIAAHLFLFPVVAALPAPVWAKAAGYGWLTVDVCSTILVVNGIDPALANAVRLGGHIGASAWVAAAAWSAGGRTRWVGYPLALLLGSYSFWGQWAPPPAIMPAMLLMLAWIFMSARRLSSAG